MLVILNSKFTSWPLSPSSPLRVLTSPIAGWHLRIKLQCTVDPRYSDEERTLPLKNLFIPSSPSVGAPFIAALSSCGDLRALSFSAALLVTGVLCARARRLSLFLIFYGSLLKRVGGPRALWDFICVTIAWFARACLSIYMLCDNYMCCQILGEAFSSISELIIYLEYSDIFYIPD